MKTIKQKIISISRFVLRGMGLFLFASLIVFPAMLVQPAPVGAEFVCNPNITVTSALDSGAGTLRQAIADVCPGGTITFADTLSGSTITLASELSLNLDVTIDCSTLAAPIAIRGPGKPCYNICFRVFTIGNSPTVTLDSLTIENGNADVNEGGAIYIDGGTLTLSNSTIKGSSSFYGGAIANLGGAVNVTGSTLKNNTSNSYGGGAIYNRDSTVNVTDSTLEGNKVKYKLGVTAAGGGIYNAGTLTVTNSTFKDNTAYHLGGGIYEDNDSAADTDSTATVTNSTLVGNLANKGGGIYINNGTLVFANTIIAASTYGGDCYQYGGTIGANLNNLVQDGSCSAALSGDPLLAPLADNDGPTQTMALQAGSPAIDAGDDATCTATPVNNLDQRGWPRPQGPHCDIGAYETTIPTTVTFEAGPYIYRGTAFTATAFVTGAGEMNQALSVSYSGDCTNVTLGGCTATASYLGDATHTASSDSKTITILPATLTVSPDARSLTYADPVPAASFYTVGVTGFISGENADNAAGYLAPTCGSAYTATTPASPPPLTISCSGGSADNYSFDYSATAALTVTRASSNTVVTFEADPYVYRGTDFTATANVTGAGGLNQALSVSYSGDCKNVTAPNGCTATATYAGDANHAGSTDSKSITITQAELTITALPVTKTYGTTYSFDKTLPSVDFSVVGLLNSDTVTKVNTLSSPGAAQWATVAGPTYPISISGANGSGLGNYNITYVPGALTITKRDALVRYIGELSFVTSGTSSTIAKVHLTASMQDPSGTELVGATVDFIDDLTGKVLAGNVPVSPVPGAIHTGTADTIVTLSSGQYGSETYLIKVVATGNYNNNDAQPNPQKTPIVVSKPAATNEATGGGALLRLPGAAGTYGATELAGAVFSVGMKYNKSGTNPQGKIVLVIPQIGSTIYVKSNSISSMAISGANSKTAVIYTKATIYRILWNGTQETIDGNVTLRMDISDSTSGDKVGFTVLSSKNSLLYYSNNWLNPDGKGWKTVLQSLLWGGLAVK